MSQDNQKTVSDSANALSEEIIHTISELAKEFIAAGGKPVHPPITARLKQNLAEVIDKTLQTIGAEDQGFSPYTGTGQATEEEEIQRPAGFFSSDFDDKR